MDGLWNELNYSKYLLLVQELFVLKVLFFCFECISLFIPVPLSVSRFICFQKVLQWDYEATYIHCENKISFRGYAVSFSNTGSNSGFCLSEILCLDSLNLTNTENMTTAKASTNSNKYGTVVKITCINGYQLNGKSSDTTFCNVSEQWEPDLPRCEGRSLLFVSFSSGCGSFCFLVTAMYFKKGSCLCKFHATPVGCHMSSTNLELIGNT